MSEPKVVDHYAVLGVPRDATLDHIRSEWLKLQSQYHPDSYTLWQINAAADVLLDAAKRAEFDASLRKADPRSPGPDSLDFSDAEPAESPVPPPSPGADADAAGARASGSESAAVARPRRTVRSDPDRPGGSRKIAVSVLVIVALGVVAFAMTEQSSKEPVKPAPTGKKPPSPPQASPAYKPPQTATPSPKLQTPPAQAPAPPAQQPQNVRPSAVPADFLPVFQEYTKRSAGGKAIALALDNDGRWAYGSVSGFAVQSDANEDALSECARNKAQAGIQANCRVFAIGDKVVW